MKGFDEGLNAEWIRIVKLSRERKINIEEAKKVFLKEYKEKYGMEYGQVREFEFESDD